ncbi:immunoglobulin domain-containing protein, partial [Bacteroidota bacterium]
MNNKSRNIFILSFIVLSFAFLLNIKSQTPNWSWLEDIHTGSNERPTDVAVDPTTGDFYVVGYFTGNTDLSGDFGGWAGYASTNSTNFTSSTAGGYGNEDGFVAKYDTTGGTPTIEWAFKIGSNQHDRIIAITVDPSGNIYITGYYAENGGSTNATADFQGTGATAGSTLTSDRNGRHFFISKYDNTGDLLWVHGATNGNNDRRHSGMDVAATNTQVFVVGYYNDEIDFEGGFYFPDIGTANQPFIMVYDNNGNQDWGAYGEVVNDWGSYYVESFTGVATDGTNVFITGYFDDEGGNAENKLVILDDSGTRIDSIINGAPNGNTAICLLSFEVDGTFDWIQMIDGDEDNEAHDLVLDTDSIYLTGSYGDNANFPGYAGGLISATDEVDFFLSSHAKSNGNTGWINVAGTGAGGGPARNEVGTSVTIDAYDNLLVTGYKTQNAALVFSTYTLAGTSGGDAFIACYSNDGEEMYGKLISGSAVQEAGFGISSNGTDMVYNVGAYSTADVTFDLLGDAIGDTPNNIYIAQIGAVCVNSDAGDTSVTDTNLCFGESSIITLSGYLGNILWQEATSLSGPYDTIFPLEIGATLNVTLGDTTYYRAIVSNACSSDTSDTVTINCTEALPTVNPTASDSTICVDETIQLNAGANSPSGITPGPGTYAWDNALGYLSATDIVNPFATPTAAATPVYFKVTVTDDAGCASTDSVPVNIYDKPTVTLILDVDEACIDDGTFALSGEDPPGGIYSSPDPGVTGIIYDPATAGAGAHTIQYKYTNGNGCADSTTDILTVYGLPTAGIAGLDLEQCDTASWYVISGDIAVVPPATGAFTYSGAPAGLNDLGDGTAEFDPQSTGLGDHTLTYTYTDANGCTDDTTEIVRVGTLIEFWNIADQYCADDGIFTFQYTPGPTAVPADYSVVIADAAGAFADLGGVVGVQGQATFDPSVAGVGPDTITYTFNDDIGCINVLEHPLYVRSVPTATITGYSTAYCSNDADTVFVGNIPAGAQTGVFSSALGALTDNGNGTADFSPSSAPVGGPYNITYTFTNNYGCEDDTTIQTTIIDIPSVTISGDTAICEGGSANLTFSFADSSGYYVGYSDGFNTFYFNTSGTDTTISVSPVDTTTYTATLVTDTATNCSGSTAGSAQVDVTPAIQITTQPTNKNACPGDNITFNVIASGVNKSYAWEFDTLGAPVNWASVGGNSSSLSRNNITSADHEGRYRVTVSSTCGGPVVSNIVNLNIGNSTSITSQPSDVIACDGTGQNFEVVASGDNLTYLWYENGFDISTLGDPNYGVTYINSTLNVSNLDNTYDGNIYTCEVSGDCGTETSDPATLEVDDPLVITSDPANQSACPGDNVSFTVVATGDPLITYQWQMKVGAGLFADTAGATSPNLVLNAVTAYDSARTYRCIVTSPCGDQEISDEASLTLNTEVSITAQPVLDTVCENGVANFQVTASGSGLSYQWKLNTVNLVDDGIISGSLTSDLTIDPVATLAHDGFYTCAVSNSCGSETTNPAELEVEQGVAITTDPISQSFCPGENLFLTVVATGDNRTYQWQKDGLNLVNSGDTSGVYTNSLVIDNIAAVHAGNYRCRVTNSCGNEFSNVAVIQVNTATSITGHPSSKNLCEGANATLIVTALGSNLTYQWQKNTVDTAGATNSTLNFTGILPGNTGNYRCRVTGSCGTQTSNTATVTVHESINITTDPQSETVCPGDNINLTVVSEGSNLSYLWFSDTSGVYDTLNGATTPGYDIIGFNTDYIGSYYCEISNNCGTENSDVAVLSLGTTTSITTHPLNDTLCEGEDANFNVVAAGSGLSYEWRLDNIPLVEGGRIVGSNTESVEISNITTADDGVYTCVVSGTCDNETSNGAALVINELVSITTHPTNDTVCVGGNANFSIVASGTDITYQWQKNGVDTLGATNPTLVIDSAITTDEALYRCIVTNTCGSTQSNAANLEVLLPVTITGDPSNAAECEGATATFTVNATGDNLSYIWLKDGSDTVNNNPPTITGATTSTVIINNLVPGDAANYSCNVYNVCNSLTSSAASLTVDSNVTITTHPASQTACPTDNINLQVVGNGTDLQYQWYFDDGGGGGFNPIGVNNSVHPIINFDPTEDGTYYCEVYNGCNSANSNNAVITEGDTTRIIANPYPDTLCVGGNVTFTTVATGSNLSYQWRKGGTNLTNTGRFSGCLSNSMTISGLLLGDFGTYSCEVSGTCGDSTSLGANLRVDDSLNITTQPASDTVCLGDNAGFTVIATGTNKKYAWQKDGSALAGQTGQSLILNPVAIANKGLYNCVITNGCESVTSTSANLEIDRPLAIISQPIDVSDCEGYNASFSLDTTGDNGSFQWYHGTDTMINNIRISDVNSKDLNINGLLTTDAGNYYCKVSNSCGTLTSNTATLVVDEEINVTTEPLSQGACIGEDVDLTVVSDGTNLDYQWYFNDGSGGGFVAIGTNDPIYSISPFVAGDSGTYYVAITNACGTENSDSAIVADADSIQITLDPLSKSTCEGNSVNFLVTASGTNPTYQWYKDGGAISGATSSSYGIASTVQSDEAVYNCIVAGTCGQEPSNIAELLVWDSTIISVQPVSYSILEGDDATFSIVASGDSLTYQWRKGVADIFDGADYSGTQTSSLIVISTTDGVDEGVYTCVVTGECGTVISNPATLTVTTSSTITVQPIANDTVCEGGTVNLSIQPSTGHTYQWQLGGVDLTDITDTITNSTGSSLTISNITPSYAGNYTCVVDGGAETSSPSLITIYENVTINTEPTDKTICNGTSTVFTVDADGDILSYQWLLNSDTLTNIADTISGANTATLSLTNVPESLEGTYRCYIVGECNSPTTSPRTLTVDSNTNILVQPVNDTICEGNSTTINVDAVGDNITYQWRKNTINISDTGTFSGTNSDELIITNALESDVGIYALNITGSCGTVTSNSARLFINPTTVITTHPTDQIKCNGDNVVFTVVAEGDSNLYQWRRNSADLTNDADISGATTSTLTINNLTDAHEGTIECYVTGICNSTTSNAATLTVNDITTITAQAASDSICEGASTILDVTVTGDNLSYQWKKNTVNISDTGTFSGTETNELSISNSIETDEGLYNLSITGSCGDEDSDPYTVTVNPTTVITSHPTNQTKCTGDNVVFTITAEGDDNTYQWRRNEADIPNGGGITGATTASITINNLTDANEGNYTCRVTGLCNVATSNVATLTVNNITVITASSDDTTICEGNSAILNVTVVGDSLNYQWTKGGAPIYDGGTITGTTTTNLIISNALETDAGTYSLSIEGACGDVNSVPAALTVNPTTIINTLPTGQTKCAGDNVVFTVNADGINTYEWRRNDIPMSNGGDTSGVNTATLTINNLTRIFSNPFSI